MIQDYDLTPSELLLFALIYGFSQDGHNTFYGSITYIEEMLKLSRSGVRKILKSLQEKDVIVLEKRSHYRVSDRVIGSQSDTEGGSQSDTAKGHKVTQTVSQSDTNKNTNNKNKNNTTGEELSPDIPKVIEAFAKVDPKNKEYYGRADMRKASHFLITEYSLEKVLGIIENLPLFIQTIPYFPTITTPKELKENWGKAKNAFIREQVAKKSSQSKQDAKKTSVSF